MYKKTLISICMLITLCTSVCAYAEQEEICEVQEIIQPEVMESAESIDTKEEPAFDADKVQLSSKEISMDMYFDEISERLSKKINLKKPEEFPHLMKGSSRVVYNNVSDYTGFICTNNLDDEQLKTINRILENGTTIQSLIQVYEFWLTTDYDISMVEEICALEDEYFSEYWYESAFNHITNDIHGVLKYDDINYYRDLGVSDDEILAANVLCRKEGQNIFDILDGVVNGVSIEAQAMEIYGVDILPESSTLFKSVTQLSKPYALALADGVNTLNITSSDAKEFENTFVQNTITLETERLKIAEPLIDPVEDYEALMRSHLPVSVQRTLLNKGYTPTEIEQTARIGGWNIAETAKRVREANDK